NCSLLTFGNFDINGADAISFKSNNLFGSEPGCFISSNHSDNLLGDIFIPNKSIINVGLTNFNIHLKDNNSSNVLGNLVNSDIFSKKFLISVIMDITNFIGNDIKFINICIIVWGLISN